MAMTRSDLYYKGLNQGRVVECHLSVGTRSIRFAGGLMVHCLILHGLSR